MRPKFSRITKSGQDLQMGCYMVQIDQKLNKKGIVSKERFNTGRGYCINRWRLV